VLSATVPDEFLLPLLGRVAMPYGCARLTWLFCGSGCARRGRSWILL